MAESSAGGSLCAALTATAGASAWFEGGVVAYSDHLKATMLGVEPELIARCGAVSGETALAMAHGIRQRLSCEIGLAETGILGPDGGSVVKPVGTVWLALVSPNSSSVERLLLRGNRQQVKDATAKRALRLLGQLEGFHELIENRFRLGELRLGQMHR